MTLLQEAAYTLQVVASQVGLVHVVGGRLSLQPPCAHRFRSDVEDLTPYCTFHFTPISQCYSVFLVLLSVFSVTHCSQCYSVFPCMQAN